MAKFLIDYLRTMVKACANTPGSTLQVDDAKGGTLIVYPRDRTVARFMKLPGAGDVWRVTLTIDAQAAGDTESTRVASAAATAFDVMVSGIKLAGGWSGGRFMAAYACRSCGGPWAGSAGYANVCGKDDLKIWCVQRQLEPSAVGRNEGGITRSFIAHKATLEVI
jgi:hypothetical protein